MPVDQDSECYINELSKEYKGVIHCHLVMLMPASHDHHNLCFDSKQMRFLYTFKIFCRSILYNSKGSLSIKQVRVIALNSVGSSPPSEPLAIRTQGEAPSGAPRSLRATPLTSRSVRVAWTPPDRSTWHGTLLGYYVGFRK